MISVQPTTSQRSGSLPGMLALAITLAGASSLCSADPVADRLFAESRVKQEQAQKLRAEAAVKLQAAGDDEAAASEAEREAKIFSARALQILKADGNRMRAFQLRNEANNLFGQYHHLEAQARNAEQLADRDRHNASEIIKAVAAVHDQPAVAAALEADGRTIAAQEKAHLADFQAKHQQAIADDKRANELWAEAERLDPEAARQVAAKPAPPVIRQVIRR